MAFTSVASDLAPGDGNGAADIFLWDRADGSLRLVSANAAGEVGNAHSSQPALSADGRYVAFFSIATNLGVDGGSPVGDVFLWDSQSPASTLSLVSTGVHGGGNGHSLQPAVSGDGRFVAFTSLATNLGAADANGEADVYLRDTQAGTTQLVSGAGGVAADGDSGWPAITANGRAVVFASTATDLVGAPVPSGVRQVYLADRLSGAVTLVSRTPGGGGGDGDSTGPALSADGRYLSYASAATDLVAGGLPGLESPPHIQIYRYETATATTLHVSVSPTGQAGNGQNGWPSLSGNGRFVAFHSGSTNFYADVVENTLLEHVWLFDLQTGARELLTDGGRGNSEKPVVSQLGDCVTFASEATDLITGDVNGASDVFQWTE